MQNTNNKYSTLLFYNLKTPNVKHETNQDGIYGNEKKKLQQMQLPTGLQTYELWTEN